MNQYRFAFIAIIIVVLASAYALSRPFSAAQNTITYSQVAPIIKRNCAWCHNWGPGEDSGLTQQSYESLVDGAYHGAFRQPVVIPGDPEGSLLVEYISGPNPKMPPYGRLSPDQVAMIRQWVADGAMRDQNTPIEHEIILPHVLVSSAHDYFTISCRSPMSKVNVSLRAKIFDEKTNKLLLYTWPQDRNALVMPGEEQEKGSWQSWDIEFDKTALKLPGYVTIHVYVANYWEGKPAEQLDSLLEGTIFLLTAEEPEDSELGKQERDLHVSVTPAIPPNKRVKVSYKLDYPSDVTMSIYAQGSVTPLFRSIQRSLPAGEDLYSSWDIASSPKLVSGWYVLSLICKSRVANKDQPSAVMMFKVRT